ncbi:hypothetical protein ACH4E7_44490 [Kitasatospora sp. NPDC018058]
MWPSHQSAFSSTAGGSVSNNDTGGNGIWAGPTRTSKPSASNSSSSGTTR